MQDPSTPSEHQQKKPSFTMILLTSFVTGVAYILLGSLLSIFIFGGLPIHLFSILLLIGILILQVYHKITNPLLSSLIYTLLILWIVISVDLIEITYYLDYINNSVQENTFKLFLTGYQNYFQLLLFQSRKFFHILYEFYGFLGYIWYPLCVLAVLGSIYYQSRKEEKTD